MRCCCLSEPMKRQRELDLTYRYPNLYLSDCGKPRYHDPSHPLRTDCQSIQYPVVERNNKQGERSGEECLPCGLINKKDTVYPYICTCSDLVCGTDFPLTARAPPTTYNRDHTVHLALSTLQGRIPTT